jgi:hypothetical protein
MGARHTGQLGPIGDVMGRTLDRDALPEIDRIIADTVEEPVGSEFIAPSAAPSRELKVGAHQELAMTQSPDYQFDGLSASHSDCDNPLQPINTKLTDCAHDDRRR